MSIVKNKDKRTGITYVYESESYWDKEKKQPRARRKLIGKLDEATGEIIPTDGRGRRRKDCSPDAGTTPSTAGQEELIREQAARIGALEAENRALRKAHSALLKDLSGLVSRFNG